jgi:hypothetical protein
MADAFMQKMQFRGNVGSLRESKSRLLRRSAPRNDTVYRAETLKNSVQANTQHLRAETLKNTVQANAHTVESTRHLRASTTLKNTGSPTMTRTLGIFEHPRAGESTRHLRLSIPFGY